MSTGAVPAPEQHPTEDAPLAATEAAPDEADVKRRWELFNEQKRQAWADMQSGSDEYDRSLLTLSSGTLALSLAFIKDVAPLKIAVRPWMLFASWIAFAASILITLVSFRLSIAAQAEHLEYARQYYLDRNDESGSRRSLYSKCLDVCNFASGIMFFTGFVLTIWFVIINVIEVVRR